MTSRDTRRNSEATKTLYEMHIPAAPACANLAPPTEPGMVVIVDQSACYPWGLLEALNNGEQPPSVAAGFVRQFAPTPSASARCTSPNAPRWSSATRSAGSPEFADLPGARPRDVGSRRSL